MNLLILVLRTGLRPLHETPKHHVLDISLPKQNFNIEIKKYKNFN
jgi:hypothetical protein